MTAGAWDLYIEQGATYDIRFVYADDSVPVDLTGRTARMQIRVAEESSNVLMELTTENGRISLGGDTGIILLHITATDTAALTAGVAVYDLELINGAQVDRLLAGQVTIDREVTR